MGKYNVGVARNSDLSPAERTVAIATQKALDDIDARLSAIEKSQSSGSTRLRNAGA
jgi:hypothetical protein